MRGNPTPHIPKELAVYSGDNATRVSGESVGFLKSQSFAWESYSRGSGVNTSGNPTAVAVLQKQFQERKNKIKTSRSEKILEKYGDQSLLLGQTEHQLQYNSEGRIIGQTTSTETIRRTKYEEDVLINNHKSVWGSWFDLETQEWGYRCCQQCVEKSYCTGEAGIRAKMASKTVSTSSEVSNKPVNNEKTLYGESEDIKLDQDKMKIALEKEKNFQRNGVASERSRKYNSFNGNSSQMDAETMEAYRMLKPRKDD
eukprot:GSMAST32.ASY1.ANO1.2088.1 assembled CDS